MTPLVSAIVSTYNSAEFITGCLEDLLNQTIAKDLEIIVIDSASKENEGQIVKRFQQDHKNIIYFRTDKRETIYKAWNRALKIVRGKYITNANTDDRHRIDALEIMSNTLDTMPDIHLVYADVVVSYEKVDSFEEILNKQNLYLKWDDWDRILLLQKCFIGPQPMWRKSLHAVFGYFDETFISSGDYEFWLRASQLFDFYHIPEILGVYYSRPDSLEKTNLNKQSEDNKIISMYLKSALENKIIRCPLISGIVRDIKALKNLTDSSMFSHNEILELQNQSNQSIYDRICEKLLPNTSWWRRLKDAVENKDSY